MSLSSLLRHLAPVCVVPRTILRSSEPQGASDEEVQLHGRWEEVEAVVRKALEHGDTVPAADIAQQLDVSEAAASSLLGTLASCGSLRILTVGGPINR